MEINQASNAEVLYITSSPIASSGEPDIPVPEIKLDFTSSPEAKVTHRPVLGSGKAARKRNRRLRKRKGVLKKSVPSQVGKPVNILPNTEEGVDSLPFLIEPEQSAFESNPLLEFSESPQSTKASSSPASRKHPIVSELSTVAVTNLNSDKTILRSIVDNAVGKVLENAFSPQVDQGFTNLRHNMQEVPAVKCSVFLDTADDENIKNVDDTIPTAFPMISDVKHEGIKRNQIIAKDERLYNENITVTTSSSLFVNKFSSSLMQNTKSLVSKEVSSEKMVVDDSKIAVSTETHIPKNRLGMLVADNAALSSISPSHPQQAGKTSMAFGSSESVNSLHNLMERSFLPQNISKENESAVAIDNYVDEGPLSPLIPTKPLVKEGFSASLKPINRSISELRLEQERKQGSFLRQLVSVDSNLGFSKTVLESKPVSPKTPLIPRTLNVSNNLSFHSSSKFYGNSVQCEKRRNLFKSQNPFSRLDHLNAKVHRQMKQIEINADAMNLLELLENSDESSAEDFGEDKVQSLKELIRSELRRRIAANIDHQYFINKATGIAWFPTKITSASYFRAERTLECQNQVDEEVDQVLGKSLSLIETSQDIVCDFTCFFWPWKFINELNKNPSATIIGRNPMLRLLLEWEEVFYPSSISLSSVIQTRQLPSWSKDILDWFIFEVALIDGEFQDKKREYLSKELLSLIAINKSSKLESVGSFHLNFQDIVDTFACLLKYSGMNQVYFSVSHITPKDMVIKYNNEFQSLSNIGNGRLNNAAENSCGRLRSAASSSILKNNSKGLPFKNLSSITSTIQVIITIVCQFIKTDFCVDKYTKIVRWLSLLIVDYRFSDISFELSDQLRKVIDCIPESQWHENINCFSLTVDIIFELTNEQLKLKSRLLLSLSTSLNSYSCSRKERHSRELIREALFISFVENAKMPITVAQVPQSVWKLTNNEFLHKIIEFIRNVDPFFKALRNSRNKRSDKIKSNDEDFNPDVYFEKMKFLKYCLSDIKDNSYSNYMKKQLHSELDIKGGFCNSLDPKITRLTTSLFKIASLVDQSIKKRSLVDSGSESESENESESEDGSEAEDGSEGGSENKNENGNQSRNESESGSENEDDN
ncbi:hypothetical protein NADFUDRAFT_52450 [Nadsonia fulvescens var. elongata DSM 6958]|uniref:Uncharacterized protein n=1 Tax=Nadsonia fulvescens var. elongata DSM 6958 TaxID=857566 RepID=A0A1E3PHZ1_9ASCO|nr:hypothetical protein NADFUDRAFT_52450 [Nadsonia fulvescens var. elongata DSM 6958]